MLNELILVGSVTSSLTFDRSLERRNKVDNIDIWSFFVIMGILVPLAIFVTVNEDKFREASDRAQGFLKGLGSDDSAN